MFWFLVDLYYYDDEPQRQDKLETFPDTDIYALGNSILGNVFKNCSAYYACVNTVKGNFHSVYTKHKETLCSWELCSKNSVV